MDQSPASVYQKQFLALAHGVWEHSPPEIGCVIQYVKLHFSIAREFLVVFQSGKQRGTNADALHDHAGPEVHLGSA